MKKITLLLLLIFFNNTTYSQVLENYYSFFERSETYQHLDTGTVLFNNTDTYNTNVSNISLGFDFEFADATYPKVTIN